MRVFLVFFTLFLLPFNYAGAVADCPFGLVDDPAPGDCALYIDGDANYICDRSETEGGSGGEVLSEEELKQKTIKEIAEIFGIETSVYRSELGKYLNKDVKGGDLLQDLHDQDGLCAGVAAGIAQAIVENPGAEIDAEYLEDHDIISGQDLKTKTIAELAEIYEINSTALVESLEKELDIDLSPGVGFQFLHDEYDLSPSVVKEIASSISSLNSNNIDVVEIEKTKYSFFQILISILALYLISFLSFKAKYITFLTHKRIWNIILLLSFLVSGIFGLMLVLAINYGWFISVYAFILHWHVEFGIVMAIITIIHILEHWRFFALIFKRSKVVKKEVSKAE